MNTGRRTFYILLQLVGALIWGLAFAFQSIGMENAGPFTFNAVRFMLATAVVFALSVFTDIGRRIARKRSGASPDLQESAEHSWKSAGLWKTGIVIGVLLSLAGNLQQIGILYTDSVGKAGFITAMYIVLVPVCGIFMKKKIRPVVCRSVGTRSVLPDHERIIFLFEGRYLSHGLRRDVHCADTGNRFGSVKIR